MSGGSERDGSERDGRPGGAPAGVTGAREGEGEGSVEVMRSVSDRNTSSSVEVLPHYAGRMTRTTTGRHQDQVHHQPDIARAAAMIADPSRARMLKALSDGRALSAGLLAAEAGVSAATASAHLGKLV